MPNHLQKVITVFQITFRCFNFNQLNRIPFIKIKKAFGRNMKFPTLRNCVSLWLELITNKFQESMYY